ncbi:MAG: ACT domain-containing protein [Planctomycetota bacterium]
MKFKPQITVFLENEPGAMAKVCKLISKQNINIDAFTVFGTVDHGVLRIIVDKPEFVLQLLADSKLLAIQSSVIEIPVPNSPGVLYKISTALSNEGVNVEYGYGSTNEDSECERFFLQASDNIKAVEILKKVLADLPKTGKAKK